MIIDLLHNQIISDTITEGFKSSVENNLVPALAKIHGEEMLGIQMYEDHLADNFLLDGVFYYPMTVILADKQVTHWVAWEVSADKFSDLIPYSYVGEGELGFDLTPDVPVNFQTDIIGRSIYCEEGLIKVNVSSASPSPTFLAGKYSQTFIDEMARQLTVAISEIMSVEGLAGSGLALQLEFAPASFMEHNSENVTYRRLLLTDGASAPRDFWVKWINHRSATPFTVSDHPLSDEIEFLIGESVPQKIREREYRYLIRTNNDKYQSAIGRRNITEWRDLIKRAIKRGKLQKIVHQIPLAEEVITVNAALASVAGLSTADVISPEVNFEEEAINTSIANELAKAAGIDFDQIAEELEVDEAPAIFEEAPVEESSNIEDELLAMIMRNKEIVANREDDDDDVIFGEDTEEIEDEVEDETEDEIEEDEDELVLEEDEDFESEEPCEDEIELEEVEPTEEPIEESVEEEKVEEIEENTVETPEELVETVEDSGTYEKPAPSVEEIEERLREGLEAKIRLEYEKQARTSAENEMIELRRKHEQLLIENRRLEAQAKKEYEERRRISEQRKQENEKLRAEIEAKAKAEAREIERLAESARMAVEEKHRLEREHFEAERRRMEDDRREAEARAKAEADARVQAERALEAERIRKSMMPETAEPAPAEEPKVDNYTYIAKNVKLLFRYSVDPNITHRIQELITATLTHYDKNDLHIRVRAIVPDNSSVVLQFLEFPQEEMDLLYAIIKVLGASGIGIAKAILEDPKN